LLAIACIVLSPSWLKIAFGFPFAEFPNCDTQRMCHSDPRFISWAFPVEQPNAAMLDVGIFSTKS
jgi:hypothetical protein